MPPRKHNAAANAATKSIADDKAFLMPETQARLIGQDAPWCALCEAYQQQRLPGAWLITGPKGIGKATMAYRFARLLLSGKECDEAALNTSSGLLSNPSDRHFRQIAQHTHPDMMVISPKIDPKTGKQAKEIHVDDIRAVGRFLHLTTSDSPFRLILIDAADDLNVGSANALLKMLEEPPRGTYFILINHHPGGLLETIRSRCRVLPCRALSDSHLRGILEHLSHEGDLTYDKSMIPLSDGSVSQALALSSESMKRCFEHWCSFFSALPRINTASLDAIVAEIGKNGNDQWHQAIGLADRLLSKAMLLDYLEGSGAGEVEGGDMAKKALKTLSGQPFDRLVEAQQSLAITARQTISLNLDKRNSLLSWAVRI